jgi:hypothetical protein
VSALQAKEEERVSAILGDDAVPHFGYDDLQQQRLLDIDRELLRMAAPDVADELIASFGRDSVSAPISSAFTGAKARADAEASRFLQHEQQRRQEQVRIKDVNTQLRSIMELERLTIDADALPPELPPGCRLVPKSRDDCAPLVVVAAPSAIQVRTLKLSSCSVLKLPPPGAAARHQARRQLARSVGVVCSAGILAAGQCLLCFVGRYCRCACLRSGTSLHYNFRVELDALLASRSNSGADMSHFDSRSE